MPTPVAHAASGMLVYGMVALRRGAVVGRSAEAGGVTNERRPLPTMTERLRIDARMIAVLVGVACAADVDYLFGLPWLAPNRFHQGWTHSAAFALLLATLILVARRASGRAWLGPLPAASIFAAAILHPCLDMITADTAAPYGIPFLWPVSDERFQAGRTLFPHVAKASLFQLFSWHNVRVVLFEFGLFLPPVLMILWFPHVRSRASDRRSAARAW
jgi:membrane-bound metal-dependent hydrolase YbcI (DUF457 family)